MPFDPRIIRPAPEDDPMPLKAMEESKNLSEGLPPELADLATKLEADAAWLASVYPASSPRGLLNDESRSLLPNERERTSIRPLLAAAVVCLVVGSAALWSSIRNPGGLTFAPHLVQSPTSEHAQVAESMPSAIVTSDSPVSAGFLWQDATGPELEGLLDLMEDDSLTGSVVSL